MLGRNTRGAALFEVRVEEDASGFARVRWSKVEAWRKWARLSEGCYVLRSNVTDWTPEDLWGAYIQLTKAEAAFRIHKSDLAIRPVWHQRENRVQAHILVCFLAYALWKALAATCCQAWAGRRTPAGIRDPRRDRDHRRGAPRPKRRDTPQALYQPAHRASANLAATTRAEDAHPCWNQRGM